MKKTNVTLTKLPITAHQLLYLRRPVFHHRRTYSKSASTILTLRPRHSCQKVHNLHPHSDPMAVVIKLTSANRNDHQIELFHSATAIFQSESPKSSLSPSPVPPANSPILSSPDMTFRKTRVLGNPRITSLPKVYRFPPYFRNKRVSCRTSRRWEAGPAWKGSGKVNWLQSVGTSPGGPLRRGASNG